MGTKEAVREIPRSIEEEMRASYLDYAMSVIVGRALPDIRDGLKPVHRRVLYGMYDMGNTHSKPYKKSARVVGDVMGKYHPHGDSAIYDTIVRMAQDFSLRYPLVDGQGNFGSIDGDSAAAMRYTEIRMDRIAEEFLEDIEKETVKFGRNYDDSLDEPLVLPTRVPNLLVNGSSGIAVGMATNIPPHNLTEICDGVVSMIRNPELSDKELFTTVKGPDFPTGGIIYGRTGIKSAFTTGRGKFIIRARAMIEDMKKGDRQQIVVTEIPYQVNKVRLIEAIANLVRNKKIEGISDLRDESDRDGMRIVIELKRDANSAVILNQLYANTQMQTSFGVIMLGLVNGQPKVVSLREAMEIFIGHRKEVVIRRTIFDLRKAEEKAHLLEGLKIALENIDEVIRIIKKSKDPHLAREALCKKFSLSERQSTAILEMRLQRLTNLERDKILEDYKATLELIKKYRAILADEKLVYNIIVDELEEIKKKYGDKRLTEIRAQLDEFSEEDLIAEEDMVVTITHAGYIKRNPVTMYRNQRRGGRGKIGTGIREEDFVTSLFVTSTHDYLLIFTDRGKLYWVKVHELPQAGRAAKGKPLVNLIRLSPQENVTAILPVREFVEGKQIVMATRKGVIKKTDLMAFSNPRAAGIIACGIDEGDRMISAAITEGNSEIFLATRTGQAIRFKEANVRSMGRQAYGVKGVELGKGDAVVGMEVLTGEGLMLTATENGYGKLTETTEYRTQSRGGKGIMTMKVTEKNGPVVGVAQVAKDDDVMLISDHGKLIRTQAKGISIYGRATQGVRLIHMEKTEKLVALAKIVPEDEEEATAPVAGNA